MLRSLLSAVKNVKCLSITQAYSQNVLLRASALSPIHNIDLLQTRSISVKYTLPSVKGTSLFSPIFSNGYRLLEPIPIPTNSTVRTVTKFSRTKGKRKSVKVVLKKFYRLDWGIWIRGRAGRNKKLYKKSANCRRRLQHHVFCNATQSRLLDKMVTKYWRKPKYYVDDPYEPYHSREEFSYTRLKPWQPPM